MVDFPAPERPVNHSTHGRLRLQLGARLLVDIEQRASARFASAGGEVQHTGANRVVGQAVDQNEATEIPILAIRRKDDRPIELEPADADIVELEFLRRDMLERVDVDFVFEGSDRGR